MLIELVFKRSYVNRTCVKEKLCYREVMLNKIYVGDVLFHIVKLNIC